MRQVVIVACMTFALVTGVGIVSAQFPFPLPRRNAYVPIVMVPLPSPTPIPSPPDPEILVLRLSDMPKGYTVDTQQRVTNEDAAQTFPDPKKALKALEDQGRQTGYFIRFEKDNFFSDAFLVTSQVDIHNEASGASAALDYVIKNKESAGYRRIGFTQFGDRSVTLQKNESVNGIKLTYYFTSIQRGIYMTIIQTAALTSSDGASATELFAQIAINKIPQR